MASLQANDKQEVEGIVASRNRKSKKKSRCVVEMETFLNEQTNDEITKATSYQHFYEEGND